MTKTLLESQEGILYFITLALSDICMLSSAASQSAHSSQTLQGFLSPLYKPHSSRSNNLTFPLDSSLLPTAWYLSWLLHKEHTLAEPSAVTERWCIIYLHTVLIVTCLDSSQTLYPFLSRSTEYYCYMRVVGKIQACSASTQDPKNKRVVSKQQSWACHHSRVHLCYTIT